MLGGNCLRGSEQVLVVLWRVNSLWLTALGQGLQRAGAANVGFNGVGAVQSSQILPDGVEHQRDRLSGREPKRGRYLHCGVFAGVGALYIGKAWEVAKTGRQASEVELANTKTQAG